MPTGVTCICHHIDRKLRSPNELEKSRVVRHSTGKPPSVPDNWRTTRFLIPCSFFPIPTAVSFTALYNYYETQVWKIFLNDGSGTRAFAFWMKNCRIFEGVASLQGNIQLLARNSNVQSSIKWRKKWTKSRRKLLSRKILIYLFIYNPCLGGLGWLPVYNEFISFLFQLL